MKCIFIRHAQYVKDPSEHERAYPLSEHGEHQVRVLSKVLSDTDSIPQLFLTSEWLHARQTAEMLAAPKDRPVVEATALTPKTAEEKFSIASLIAEASAKGYRLETYSTLARVGHEPRLRMLAARLTSRNVHEISRSGAICIAGENWHSLFDGVGVVRWRCSGNLIMEDSKTPETKAALNIIENFIDLGKQVAKLPALVLPQYQSAANDLYRISQVILKSNENLSRWLNRFRYFDFIQADARKDFLQAMQEYKAMKSGPDFQQLKFSCHDLAKVYYSNIASKIGNWFSNQQKKEEAEGIFSALTDADQNMLAFVSDAVISQIDEFLENVEELVDSGNLEEAERNRLALKRDTTDIVAALENFGGGLSALVIEFANIAKRPITLSNSDTA
jgi:phosphohistidine phosphatase SixA